MKHRIPVPPVLAVVLAITIPLNTQVAGHSEGGEDVRRTSGGQEPCSNFEGTIELANLDGSNGFAIEGAGSFSAAGAGDLNADGYNDLLIGDPNNDQGYVRVIFGGADVGASGLIDVVDLDGTNGFVIAGSGELTFPGVSVAGGGDFNADGIDDLLFAEADFGGLSKVYVIFGNTALGAGGSFDLATLDGTNGFIINTTSPFSTFYWPRVAAIGDVNGDGTEDLAIGEPIEATVDVIFGGTNIGSQGVIDVAELDGGDGLRITGGFWGGLFGASVSGRGDVNGDGIVDILVGAPGAISDQGLAYVLFGQGLVGQGGSFDVDDLDGSNGFMIEVVDPNPYHIRFFGLSASGEGDINGDGFSDMIIGAPFSDVPTPELDQGAVIVIFGGPTVGASGQLTFDALDPGGDGFSVFGLDEGDRLGQGSAFVGDIDFDGFDDVLAGARMADPNGLSQAGEAYLLLGRPDVADNHLVDLTTLDGGTGFTLNGAEANDQTGVRVKPLGDFNGDGIDDMIITAPRGGAPQAGVTYVIFGRPAPVDCNNNGVCDYIDFIEGDMVDCNANNRHDECDIAGGSSPDGNDNGVPDECESIRRYVDADAGGLNNGSSWANALTDLQVALTLATADDEIWVAAGTYLPDQGSGDRTVSFRLQNRVAVYGGFGGTEKTLEERAGLFDQTILSGNLGNPDSDWDNSYHVLTAQAVNETAILDGFTITGGNADGPTGDLRRGGGMHILGSSPTLANCTFSGHYAYELGGAIFNSIGSAPTLTHCIFVGNEADDDGGAFYNASNASATFVDCLFDSNQGDWGGAFYNASNAHATFIACLFDSNVAFRGAGLYCAEGSDAELTGCTFDANTGGFGTLYIEGSNPILEDCTFSGNNGAAIYNDSSSPILNDCTFTGNDGGQGSAVFNTDGSNPQFTGCTFDDNTASEGGAIYNEFSSSPSFTNCVFIANTADNSGGAIYNHFSSSPSLVNCTFTGNTATEFGGAVYSFHEADPQLTDCDFEGNSANEGGALYNRESSPLLIGCTFTANTASLYGGAIRSRNGSNVEIVTCTFAGNTAAEGGATHSIFGSNLTFTDCTLTGNSATANGGGIFHDSGSLGMSDCSLNSNSATVFGGGIFYDDGTLSMNDCSFSSNTASRGGAVAMENVEATVDNCQFIENVASDRGGALYSEADMLSMTGCSFISNEAWSGGAVRHMGFGPSLSVVGCLFLQNTALSIGGGLYNNSSADIVRSCIFQGNQASIRGGGLYEGGGDGHFIQDCIFTGNSLSAEGGDGGGCFIWGSAMIDHCTISDNSTPAPGAGVFHVVDSLSITNTVLWGNSSAGVVDEEAQVTSNTSPAIDFSCVEGLTGELGGVGNIGTDPQFVDPENGDYHLSVVSPCANTGDPEFMAGEGETDWDGDERILHCRTDMGIDEVTESLDCNGNDVADSCDIADATSTDCNSNTVPDECDLSDGTSSDFNGNGVPDDCECLADFDGDGVVGPIDLATLLGSWGSCADCPADLNADGEVDPIDLATLLGAWGPCP